MRILSSRTLSGYLLLYTKVYNIGGETVQCFQEFNLRDHISFEKALKMKNSWIYYKRAKGNREERRTIHPITNLNHIDYIFFLLSASRYIDLFARCFVK